MAEEPTAVVVVEGGPADLDTVFAITRATFYGHGDGTAPVEPRSEEEAAELSAKRERLVRRVEEHAATVMLAKADGRTVGFSLGYESDPGAYYYWLSAVLPEYQHRGIGRQLLRAQIGSAQERDFERVWFASDNEATDMIILGLHEGFKIVKAEFSPQQQCVLVHMEKQLAPSSEDGPS